MEQFKEIHRLKIKGNSWEDEFIMKKILILMIGAILILSGCSHPENNNKTLLVATILENNGSYLVVEPIKGSVELNSADKIKVSIGNNTVLESKDKKISVEHIEIGHKVEILYDGTIAESYPAQINNCYSVQILDYNVFTTEDENFLVKTYINKLEFKEKEEISMYSTIEYIGEKDSITIWSGEPYFHYEIYDGKEYFSEGMTQDILKQTVLNKGEIYTIPFSKSGGYSEEDPKADFWKQYYSEKELKLPKGKYFFTAYTDFSLNKEQVENIMLKIEFEVNVN